MIGNRFVATLHTRLAQTQDILGNRRSTGARQPQSLAGRPPLPGTPQPDRRGPVPPRAGRAARPRLPPGQRRRAAHGMAPRPAPRLARAVRIGPLWCGGAIW